MPADSYTNARPYFDVTFPSSGDSFSIAGFRNALAGLGFLDHIPLQPRAHNPANLSIMVRGQDASQFFTPVYFGNSDQRTPFSSGDTSNFSAPASNPRIDIVYMTPSGDYKIQQGTEAASPTLPSLAPSGDTRFPIAAVYCKVGMAKVVNFEDKDSNSGDGYIYKDLRPWLRNAGAGAVGLSTVTPVSITGDNALGVATGAARADHHHQGVHTVRLPGSGDIFGDIEIRGDDVIQTGNRLDLGGKTIRAAVVFVGATAQILSGYNVQSVIRNNAGDYTISWKIPFPNVNYCVDAIAGPTRGYVYCISAPVVGSVNIGTTDNNGASLVDQAYVSVTAFNPRANG